MNLPSHERQSVTWSPLAPSSLPGLATYYSMSPSEILTVLSYSEDPPLASPSDLKFVSTFYVSGPLSFNYQLPQSPVRYLKFSCSLAVWVSVCVSLLDRVLVRVLLL